MSLNGMLTTIKQSLTVCCVTKTFNFRDRGCRAEFWPFFIFTYLASSVLALLVQIPFVGPAAAALINLYLLIALLSAAVRRLHDIERPGTFVLLPLIPASVMTGTIIWRLISYENLEGLNPGTTEAAIFLITVISLIYLLVLFLTAGTLGPNSYGPDPTDPANEDYRLGRRPGEGKDSSSDRNKGEGKDSSATF